MTASITTTTREYSPGLGYEEIKKAVAAQNGRVSDSVMLEAMGGNLAPKQSLLSIHPQDEYFKSYRVYSSQQEGLPKALLEDLTQVQGHTIGSVEALTDPVRNRSFESRVSISH